VWGIAAAARPSSKQEPPPTVPVQRGAVISTVSADGTVEPPGELSLAFPRSGRVVEIVVDEGAHVRRGQLLARIDDRSERAELDATRSELASARARLQQTREGRTALELAENQRLAEESRTAVRSAERDLTNARQVGRTDVAALRRAVARAQVSGERADLRASELRLAQERGEVVRLEHHYADERARADRYRGQLLDLIERESDARAEGDLDEVTDLEADVTAAQTRLEAAQSDEQTAKSDLETARANVRTYISDVESDRVALRDAGRSLGDARDNLANGIATAQQEVDAARNSLAESQAELRVQIAANRVDEQGPRAAELAADLANIATAQASVEAAVKALDDTQLRAPVDGVIGKVDARVGELVGGGLSSLDGATRSDEEAGSSGSQAGSGASRRSDEDTDSDAVITLTQTEGLEVEVPFNETDAARLRPGDPATISVDAVPDRKFAARVASIEPVDTVINNVVTYEATLVLDSPQASLRPGMTATAEVIVDRVDHALTLPKDAVRTPQGANPTVTVVRPDGLQQERLVVTGLEGDSNVQVIGGVGLGERVVRARPASSEPSL
jgi:HlyD family secretion protein